MLSWDDIAKRWTVIFDAEKVQPSSFDSGPQSSNSGPGYNAASFGFSTTTTPLLDPKADVQVEKVAFAHLLPGKSEQLLFSSTTSYGGSGVGSNLTVLDVTPTDTRIVYAWNGEGLRSWHVAGKAIRGDAEYWTPADAHCCPSRTYKFTVSPTRNGYFAETRDQRPYLGVLVRDTAGGGFGSSLEVLQVDPHSHARGRLLKGDVIVGVVNAPPPQPGSQDPANRSVDDEVSGLDAGETAQLRVERAGATLTVPIELGSLADPSATSQVIPSGAYDITAL